MRSTRFIVCPTCEGRGTHVNRNVDGHGITSDEMDELGPDFFDDYMSGVYDVRCEECHGQRVVVGCPHPGCNSPTADLEDTGCYEHVDDDTRELLDDIASMNAMQAAEIRAGC